MQTDASEERLSKYELIRLLGTGGMGEVYLARDTVLQRQVAIKFVSAARLNDPAANARLIREARAAATLDHPGICSIYDVQVDRTGRTCIVMQYIEGETLAQRLARGPLPAAEAAQLAAQIADALAAAHAHGVTHRDLKPQNIVLTAGGRPKLLDFGIAQVDLPPEVVASIETHTNTGLSLTGNIVGTPAYMSPEQVLRKAIDGRSDLFSLGAVLFECLTGQPAFLAGTDVETWGRVVYLDPPAPSAVNPQVPASLDVLVSRLLAKDPAARFGTAAEAAAALRDALPRHGTPTAAPLMRMVVPVAIALIVLLAGIGGWRLNRVRPLPPAPPDAQAWYDRGTEHLRNAAYYSAQKALNEAIRIYPAYAQAYARLAEADSELDDEGDAQTAMVRLSAIVPDASRLSGQDRLRIEAVRALILRNLPAAIAAYEKITAANPNDRGAWLDLARVRHAAGFRGEARRAAEKALQINNQYAAGHLRLAIIAADAVQREEALKEFAEAERLYRAAADVEGQTEVLLLRGRFLNANGDLPGARAALDSATALTAQSGNKLQEVRAALLRSGIAVKAGDPAGAKQMAQDAVQKALENGFDTAAAEGLIDLATALQVTRDYAGARAELERAAELARRRGANRVAARAALQLASAYLSAEQPSDARAMVEGILPFVKQGQYKRLELQALLIKARADEDLDPPQAERVAREVLAIAESLHDDGDVAVALDGLAAQAALHGSLPEALALRTRLEGMHRQQQNMQDLSYDLQNRADLLIRLGRFSEGEAALAELDAGAQRGVKPFAARARRVALLRALAAIEQQQFANAAAAAQRVIELSDGIKTPDFAVALADAFLALTRAEQRGRGPLAAWTPVPASSAAELRYWRAAAWLTRGDAAAAAAEVDAGLTALERYPSAEYEWRVASLGTTAAQRQRDTVKAQAMAARARDALSRLRAAWKGDVAAYEKRPDLVERKRSVGAS